VLAAVDARMLVLDAETTVEEIGAGVGHEAVVGTGDPDHALALATRGFFEMVCLAADAPADKARELVRTVRRRRSTARVIVLCSGLDAAVDRIVLELGADAALLRTPDLGQKLLAALSGSREETPRAMPDSPRLLIVDDDVPVLESVRDALSRRYDVTALASPLEALIQLKRQPFEILITDAMMAELSGLQLIRCARAIRPMLAAIVITGYGSKEVAIDAVRGGAHDLLEKPLTPQALRRAVERAWRLLSVEFENQQLLDALRLTNQQLVREAAARKKLEIQRIQAQKLEAVGQLAAGIAHEINNPVQFVTDNTQFVQQACQRILPVLAVGRQLLQEAQAGSCSAEVLEAARRVMAADDLDFLCQETPRAITDALGGLERIAGIVQAMRDFAHPGTAEKGLLSLNEVVGNLVTVSRSEWTQVAEMKLDLDPTLPSVPCLPGAINQALLNIIINAAHAVSAVTEAGGAMGRIRIQTRVCGVFAEVRIEDSGPGIPESIQHRIFEPFFTTKPMGRGTGQGLAIAHSIIVQQHGGELTFESEPGAGTTFVVRLPLRDPGASGKAHP
jgi:signal transduction histidine kinase